MSPSHVTRTRAEAPRRPVAAGAAVRASRPTCTALHLNDGPLRFESPNPPWQPQEQACLYNPGTVAALPLSPRAQPQHCDTTPRPPTEQGRAPQADPLGTRGCSDRASGCRTPHGQVQPSLSGRAPQAPAQSSLRHPSPDLDSGRRSLLGGLRPLHVLSPPSPVLVSACRWGQISPGASGRSPLRDRTNGLVRE